MSMYVPLHIRREIRQRANQLCEYCLIHEDDVILPHEPEHIIAAKHDGPATTNRRGHAYEEQYPACRPESDQGPSASIPVEFGHPFSAVGSCLAFAFVPPVG